MPPLLVCIHDATPAYVREIGLILRDLAPLVGRRLSLGVVPNWGRQWHLMAHPEFCRLAAESAEELLLHGYFHRRQRGWGPTTWLAEGSDEMNGLSEKETRRTLERGQQVFFDVFGAPARGFLPPAWERGRVKASGFRGVGLDYVVGYFGVESQTGRSVRLTTWTWDCGRWGWLGHVGHGIGWLSQKVGRGVPVLAIHPRDLERGFWPKILQLTGDLLAAGYEPTTVARLLGATTESA